MTDLHPATSIPTVSVNGDRGRTGHKLAPAAAPLRPRRRPVFIALGVALAAAGGVLTATIVARSGDRVAVLALERPVPVGATITAGDLTVAHVAADPALSPVRAGDESSVVGRVAAVGLPAGSLLTRSDISASGVPAAGQQLVGVAVKPGQLPARALAAGSRVLIVETPGGFTGSDSGSTQASGALVSPVPASVVDVSAPETDGTVVIDLLVGSALGPRVAGIASTGHVALIEQPVGGGS